MWCCTGRSRVAFAFALALGACASDPDALLTVAREGEYVVRVQVCPIDGVCSTGTRDLFTADQLVTVERTVGVYLKEEADELFVRFAVIAPDPVCKQVRVPFDENGARTMHVSLPVDLTVPTVTGCDDCMPEDCTQ